MTRGAVGGVGRHRLAPGMCEAGGRGCGDPSACWQGESGSDVQLLGVSHRGLRLLKVAQGPRFHSERLKTLCSYR